MKKKLIEVGNLDSFICPDSSTIYVDNTMILTPGAKDELGKRKITIARVADAFAVVGGHEGQSAGGCEEAQCDDAERFMLGVAVMLKEEYGIEDMEHLQILSARIADTIKNNI